MLSKSLSFRKGRDDGDWRLGWKGNCGTSRHQPLLSVATHILFLSTTLSWGQCPFWSGQGVAPECYARDEHREPLTQPLQLADPRRRVLTDYTRLEGGRDKPQSGWHPSCTSWDLQRVRTDRGKEDDQQASLEAWWTTGLMAECWWPAVVRGRRREGRRGNG